MNHLIFLPWRQTEVSAELLTSFQFEDRKIHLPLLTFITKYKFHLYCWQQDDPNLNAVFGNLSSKAVIYVRGHGAVGADDISLTRAGDKALKFDVVCDRLINTGLKPTFGGKIKFYNCCSSDSGSGTAFAQRSATYLRGQHYQNCRIFGYSGELSTHRQDMEPDPPEVYVANPSFEPIKHKYPHKWTTSSDGVVSRAKESRVEYP